MSQRIILLSEVKHQNELSLYLCNLKTIAISFLALVIKARKKIQNYRRFYKIIQKIVVTNICEHKIDYYKIYFSKYTK